MARSRITGESEARADARPRVNLPEWTVSELSAALKRTVEDAYGFVRVRGEVSGFKGPSPSGHCYFRLKDDKAVLEGVIWKGVWGRMRVKPEEGLDVIVSGKLTTFAGSSKYQLVIDTLEPAGVGALMKLLEERKKKLAAEGLFDEARKQLLPFLPDVIGVVTSPTGAVIRDILHRLADRFPRRVLVWPVRVQGEASAAEVANAIDGFNALPERGALPRPDLIIVARGGGSLEDLWSFNEEIVVRAAADSMIPLISAVGHETDITLIDFASDRRAPTPTAAAEMAVPVRAELMAQIAALTARRARLLAARHRAAPQGTAICCRARCRRATNCWRCRASGSTPAPNGLPRALHANAQMHHTQSARASPRAWRRSSAEAAAGALAAKSSSGARASAAQLRPRRSLSRSGAAQIALRSAGAIARGVLLSRRAGARLCAGARRRAAIRCAAAAAVAAGMRLEIEFSDGRVGATADGEGAPQPAAAQAEPKPRPRGGEGSGGQGTLL